MLNIKKKKKKEKNLIWRLILNQTLSYDMSIVNLT